MMSGRGFQRFVYRLFDPGEFGCAVAGATLQVDFLARQVSAASIERFVGEDWALDTYDAGVKARMYGPLLPGRVSLCLMLRDEVSSQYGLDLGEGCLLCNPPGVPSDGDECAAVDVGGVPEAGGVPGRGVDRVSGDPAAAGGVCGAAGDACGGVAVSAGAG